MTHFGYPQSIHQIQTRECHIQLVYYSPINTHSILRMKPITCMHDGKLMVPILSCLHFLKTIEKRLNGVRVTLGDIIGLKGAKPRANRDRMKFSIYYINSIFEY